MTITDFEIIAIGGSSGSIPVLMNMLNAVPKGFNIPIVIIIHRMKNVESDLKTILSHTLDIREPEDKEPIQKGYVYLAPQNYHLLVEENRTFSLDYSELVNYSRPSIDVTFTDIANVYREKALGILLSGANKDGAQGLSEIIEKGGMGIAQDPATADYAVMPESAIKINDIVKILTPESIVNTIFACL